MGVYRKSDARICTKAPVVAYSTVAFTSQGTELLVSISCMHFFCVCSSVHTYMRVSYVYDHRCIYMSINVFTYLRIHYLKNMTALISLQAERFNAFSTSRGVGSTHENHLLSYSVVYAHAQIAYTQRHPPTPDQSSFI